MNNRKIHSEIGLVEFSKITQTLHSFFFKSLLSMYKYLQNLAPNECPTLLALKASLIRRIGPIKIFVSYAFLPLFDRNKRQPSLSKRPKFMSQQCMLTRTIMRQLRRVGPGHKSVDINRSTREP